MSTLIIDAKVVGNRKPVFSDWHIDIPEPKGDFLRLRDLITRIVVEEVEAFNKRQADRKLSIVLSPAQIEQGKSKGKIDSGGKEYQQEANKDTAIATALQAFEDGLYYVFIDGQQQTDLDEEVFLKSESQLTFIRLVALVGG